MNTIMIITMILTTALTKGIAMVFYSYVEVYAYDYDDLLV